MTHEQISDPNKQQLDPETSQELRQFNVQLASNPDSAAAQLKAQVARIRELPADDVDRMSLSTLVIGSRAAGAALREGHAPDFREATEIVDGAGLLVGDGAGAFAEMLKVAPGYMDLGDPEAYQGFIESGLLHYRGMTAEMPSEADNLELAVMAFAAGSYDPTAATYMEAQLDTAIAGRTQPQE